MSLESQSLAKSAAMLADSARSMDAVMQQLEQNVQQQNDIFDDLSKKITKAEKNDLTKKHGLFGKSLGKQMEDLTKAVRNMTKDKSTAGLHTKSVSKQLDELIKVVKDQKVGKGNSAAGSMGGGGGRGPLGQFEGFVGTLGNFAKTLPELAKGLVKFGVLAPKKTRDNFLDFVTSLSHAIGTSVKTLSATTTKAKGKYGEESSSSGSSSSGPAYEAFGDMFALIGKSTTKLAWGLFWFDKLVSKNAETKFIQFINKIGDALTKLDGNKVQKGADGLDHMSKAIFMFGLSLVASAVLFAVGAVASVIIIPVLAGYVWVFEYIGKHAPNLKKGGQGVESMARGLALFALALFAVEMLSGGWEDFAKGSLMVLLGLAAFTLAFELIGKNAKNLEAGGKGVAWMALGIASLAIGIWVFQALKIDAKSVLIAALAVGLFAIEFALLGEVGGDVKKGAEGLMLAGLAIAVLGLGILAFKWFVVGKGDDYKKGWETLAIVGAAVAGITIALWFLAKRKEDTVFGALALIVAGIAIAAIGFGLSTFQKYNIGFKTLIIAGLAIAGLATVMTDAGADAAMIALGAGVMILAGASVVAIGYGLGEFTKYNIGWETLAIAGSAVTGLGLVMTAAGAVSLLIGAGALAMGLAGGALIAIGYGIKKISDAYAGVGNLFQDAPGDHTRFGLFHKGEKESNFETMMDAIVYGMSINPVTGAMLAYSIPILLGAGAALTVIGAGLSRFSDIISSGVDVKTIGDTVSTVLTAMIQTFSDIGSGKSIGKGQPISWWSVMKGVSMASGIGNVLCDMAKGVQAMAKMKFPEYDKNGKVTGYTTITNTDLGLLSSNIEAIIKSIGGALVEVGKSEGETGFFSFSNATKGRRAIDGVGRSISEIAKAVQDVANLKFQDYWASNGKLKPGVFVVMQHGDFVRVSSNIKAMIMAITSTLIDVGTQGTGGWFHKDAVEKGKSAIDGVGKNISDIAGVVKDAASLTFQDYWASNGKIKPGVMVVMQPADFRRASSNIRMMISTITDALIAVGAKDDSSPLSKANVNKGKDAIDGVGKMISSIVDVVKAMAGVKDFDTANAEILKIISSFPNAVATSYLSASKALGGNFSDAIGQMKDIAEPISKYVDLLVKFQQSKVSKGIGDMLASAITGLFRSISNIPSTVNFKSLGDATGFIERLANSSSSLVKLANSFDKLTKGLHNFTSAFKQMNAETVKNSTALMQSLVVFSKVDPKALGSLADKGQSLLKYIYENSDKKPGDDTGDGKKTDNNAVTTNPQQTPAPPPARKSASPPVVVRPDEGAAAQMAELKKALADLGTKFDKLSFGIDGINSKLGDKSTGIAVHVI